MRLPGNGRLSTAFRLIWRVGKARLAWLLAFDLLSAICTVVSIIAVQRITESLQASRSLAPAPSWVIAGAVALLASSLAMPLKEYQTRLLTESVSSQAGADILRLAARRPLADLDNANFYNQLNRAQFAVDLVPMQVVGAVSTLLSATATGAALVSALAALAPVAILLAATMFVVLAMVVRRNARAAVQFLLSQTEIERMRSYLIQISSDRLVAPEVRLFNLEPYLVNWHLNLSHTHMKALRATQKRRATTSSLAHLALTALTIVALTAVLVMYTRSVVSFSTAAAVAYALVLVRAVAVAGALAAAQLVEGGLFLSDYRQLVASAPKQPQVSNKESASPKFTSVELVNVCYAYPDGGLALADVTMQLKAGEIVGLIGSNGSGKTTTLKLLSGLYQPLRGSVCVNGLTINPERLRQSVSMMSQTYGRYWFTVRQNLSLPVWPCQPDDDDLKLMLDRVGLGDKVEALERGLDTSLGAIADGAVDLSVGEWQRLALARFLIDARDASLLLLDEPSAALDAVAEAQFFATLRGIAMDRLVCVVSHHLRNLEYCDRVYKLEAGRVLRPDAAHDAPLPAGRR